jgi:hypothetical protein
LASFQTNSILSANLSINSPEMRFSAISTSLLVAGSATASLEKRAPLITRDESAIEGKYIVMMKSTSDGNARVASAAKSIDVKPDMVFDNLGGFSASLSARDVEDLRNNPSVSITRSFPRQITD